MPCFHRHTLELVCQASQEFHPLGLAVRACLALKCAQSNLVSHLVFTRCMGLLTLSLVRAQGFHSQFEGVHSQLEAEGLSVQRQQVPVKSGRK